MTKIPERSEITWTGGGVFVVTNMPDDGPDPASTEKFVANAKQRFLEYMAQLWDSQQNREGNGE